jgi:hypothetical protein
MSLVLTREKHQGIYFDSVNNGDSVSNSVHLQFSGMLQDLAGWKCKIHAYNRIKVDYVDIDGQPQSQIIEAKEHRLLSLQSLLRFNFIEVNDEESAEIIFERSRSKHQFKAIISAPRSVNIVREELEARTA